MHIPTRNSQFYFLKCQLATRNSHVMNSRFSWDAMLKMADVILDPNTDIGMNQFVEKVMIGG